PARTDSTCASTRGPSPGPASPPTSTSMSCRGGAGTRTSCPWSPRPRPCRKCTPMCRRGCRKNGTDEPRRSRHPRRVLDPEAARRRSRHLDPQTRPRVEQLPVPALRARVGPLTSPHPRLARLGPADPPELVGIPPGVAEGRHPPLHRTPPLTPRSDRSRPHTHARHDSAPQIHPNWSASRRAERNAAAQLYIGSTLETAHQTTDNHLGVSEFAIDDAGARALYVARVAEPGRYGLDDDVPAAEEAPRRITTSAYLSNGLGYTDDRPARAFLVDLAEPGLGQV